MYNSQDGQDKYLDTSVFKGMENGVYVDVGAHDGKTINNTLFFHKYRNWVGINIEPIKSVYDQLVLNRPADININVAVCSTDGTANFIQNSGYTEMISGLASYYDTRHTERLAYENKHTNSTTAMITVPTQRLETIFDQYNIKHVDYLSIDVEGAEFEVIKSINFDKVTIDVIGFENNYNDVSIPIVEYLEARNYHIIHKSMDIFMQYASATLNLAY